MSALLEEFHPFFAKLVACKFHNIAPNNSTRIFYHTSASDVNYSVGYYKESDAYDFSLKSLDKVKNKVYNSRVEHS